MIRRPSRLLLLLVPVLALVALAWWEGRPAGAYPEAPAAATPPPAAERTALPVETLRVEEVDAYQVTTRYAGRVVSRRTSELGFERGGRLVSLEVDEGASVEAGRVLASLDARELRARRQEIQARVAASRARVAEIEARLALARRTTERRRQLLERESISAQRFDESRFEAEALDASLAAARADIAAAEGALRSVDVALALSTLRAPYAGSIVARWADEGTVVTPGQRILTLVEDGVLEVRVGLPPEAAAGLEPGGVHAVEIGGREHPARLHALLERVEPDTRTLTGVFRFDARPPGVRDGEVARVALGTRVEARGFWLPITALTESRRGLWSAYALAERPDGLRVEPRQLEVLHAESDRVFARGTLRGGETVVATGLHRLVPGQRVRPAASPAPAPEASPAPSPAPGSGDR